MTTAPILALDIGSTSVKAGRFSADGDRLGEAIVVRHRDGAEPGVVDAVALAAAAERAIRATGVDGVDVVSASSVWHALVALAARGEPIGPALTWEATRPPGEREALAARLGSAWSHEESGGYLHPSHAIAALPALLERRPHRVVDLASFVVGRLAGCDVAWPENIAAGSGLWLPASREWNSAALEALGVAPGVLGTAWSAAVDGAASPIRELRSARWLPPAGDGLCHNLGQAAVDGRVAVTIGTSGSVRAVGSGAPFGGLGHGLWRYRVAESTVVTGGAVTSAGNVLEWATRLFGRHVPWGMLDAARLARLPRTDPSVFGRRGPDYPWRARGAVHDLGPETTADDILLALAVDVLRVFADHLAALRGVLATPIGDVVVEGGVIGAAPIAAQLLADALGMPVSRTLEAQPSLAGAARLGVAEIARPGAGIDDVVDAIRRGAVTTPTVETLDPRPEFSRALRDRWSSSAPVAIPSS